MREILPKFSRLVDVRRGEWLALAKAFATLMLLITAHTALETARDALILTRLPSNALGIVYVAVATCALPAVWLASRAAVRFGPQRALGGGLVTAAVLLIGLFLLPMNRATAVAVYVTSGLVGAVLVPLFWNVVASTFNMSQARRLLGIVGAAGVLGGALGSAGAAALLFVVHTRALLLVSSAVLVLTAVVVARTPATEDAPAPRPSEVLPTRRDAADLREEPFLRRIALLVVVSTLAGILLDYFFKWTVARAVPHAQIAHFVARYYAWLNGLSMVAQILVTGALVRRVGVATTMVVIPLLLVMGGVGALAGTGALMVVLAVKALDGTLRNSVHRVTMELVYLPVPPGFRARAKPFIDGALARITQAAAGVLLLGLAGRNYLSARLLAGLVVAATLLWLAVALTTRAPYLALLRHAVMGDRVPPPEMDPIDLESAESLEELLAHDNPLVVLGAMNALARRGRGRLVPALILLHEDEAVRVRALGILGASRRQDWFTRARRLLSDPMESVRTAAARALALHGRLDAKDLALDADPRIHAYAVLQLSLGIPQRDPLEDPAVAELLDRAGAAGEESRLGLLAVLVDSKRDPRLARLLATLETRSGMSREWTEGLAKAAVSQGALDLIPQLVSRLALPDTRETLRTALVSLGDPAMDCVWETLLTTRSERRLRVHLPTTLARFGTETAAELLLQCIETEGDGLVRYKAIRGLGRIVAEQKLRLNRERVERLIDANLVEHFRLLGLRAPFTARSRGSETGNTATTEVVLVGLLDDKLRQSLERAFRLLKIAYPNDHIHHVQVASQSGDSRVRANAAEFLNTLLRRHTQRRLRELFLVIADDLTISERVARGSALLHTTPPATREAALARLVDDRDAVLAALATLHVASIAGKAAHVAFGGGTSGRPRVEFNTVANPPAMTAKLRQNPDA
jgi:AAA family ATP:ADP antiporter